MRKEKVIILTTLAIVALTISYKMYSDFIDESDNYNQKISLNPCINDWHKCKDLNQLFNDYIKIDSFEYECKDLADDTLEYGPPEWKGFPYKPFVYHYTITPFHKTGYVVLIEKDALIPNKFGGKERKQLDCYVNLDNGKPDKILMPDQ